MTALVTGGSGVLGQCVTTLLLRRGERVRVLDLVPPPVPAGEGAGAIECVQGDMRDAALVARACRGVDVVYHLAAAQRMKPQFRGMSEREIHDANVEAVAHALDGARAAGVRKVIFTSSSGVYGVPRTVPVDEDHPQRPLGAYGESKIAGEALCRRALDAGLDVTVFRPMSLFGPGMTGVFVLLFEWVRRGKRVYLLGSGRNRVQMVSAWDVADACLLAASTPAARGRTFNLGADEVPTVREQVERLIAHAGTGSSILAIPAGLLRTAARALDLVHASLIVPEHYLLADKTFTLDTTAAHDVLGWRPRFTNVALTIDAYEWYCRHWSAYRPDDSLVLKLLDRLS